MKTKIKKCFLCHSRWEARNPLVTIQDCMCPSSKKSVEVVLQHLAQLSKLHIHIEKSEMLCAKCFMQLNDYDAYLVLLLKKQKVLLDLVEKSLIDYDEVEEICNVENENFSKLNNELALGGENICDAEIEETIKDALGKTSSKYKLKNKRLDSKLTSNECDTSLQCSLCAMAFRTKIKLQKHLIYSHKKYSCSECDYCHRNEDYVKLHMNLHEGKTENQCRFCDKTFSTKISTMRHMEAHMDIKKYQCDKCGLCFSQSTIMYNHKLQHEAEEKPLRCELCCQSFKTKRTYRHHIITHRQDRPRYSCEICGKSFTEKYTLKVHSKTHQESSSLDIRKEPNLSTHEVSLNELDETQYSSAVRNIQVTSGFQCVICCVIFNEKEHLRSHMEKEHTTVVETLSVNNYNEFNIIENVQSDDGCGKILNTQPNLYYHKFNIDGSLNNS